MTSNDTGVYLREDVFNARMDAFMAEIRLENERLRNELITKIDGVDRKLDAKIEGVQTSLNTKIDGVQTSLGGKIYDVERKLDTKIEGVQTSLTAKIEGYQALNEHQFTEIHDEFRGLLAHIDSFDMRITDFQNTMSLGFMLMAVVIAVSGIMTGACIAFAPSIWGYIGRKRRSKQLRNTATR